MWQFQPASISTQERADWAWRLRPHLSLDTLCHANPAGQTEQKKNVEFSIVRRRVPEAAVKLLTVSFKYIVKVFLFSFWKCDYGNWKKQNKNQASSIFFSCAFYVVLRWTRQGVTLPWPPWQVVWLQQTPATLNAEGSGCRRRMDARTNILFRHWRCEETEGYKWKMVE